MAGNESHATWGSRPLNTPRGIHVCLRKNVFIRQGEREKWGNEEQGGMPMVHMDNVISKLYNAVPTSLLWCKQHQSRPAVSSPTTERLTFLL